MPIFRDMPALVREGATELHHAILALRRAPKPVLASVHGAVAGAGVSLMAAADLAIAAEDTKFTMAYSRLGTSPDGGATYSLPRLVGYRKALELMLLSDTVRRADGAAAGAGQLGGERRSGWRPRPRAIARRLAQGATHRVRRDQAAGQPELRPGAGGAARSRDGGVRALRGDARLRRRRDGFRRKAQAELQRQMSRQDAKSAKKIEIMESREATARTE